MISGSDEPNVSPLFEILERGQVLVIDELDKSLHALLVRHLIERF